MITGAFQIPLCEAFCTPSQPVLTNQSSAFNSAGLSNIPGNLYELLIGCFPNCRRPNITILAAEPLVSNSWFPGSSGSFPPAPPPAQPPWTGSVTVQVRKIVILVLVHGLRNTTIGRPGFILVLVNSIGWFNFFFFPLPKLPPPSYEQVIREKSREQNTQTSSVSSSSSSSSSSPSSTLSSSTSSSAPRHTTTIATQTDPEPSEPQSCTRPSSKS